MDHLFNSPISDKIHTRTTCIWCCHADTNKNCSWLEIYQIQTFNFSRTIQYLRDQKSNCTWIPSQRSHLNHIKCARQECSVKITLIHRMTLKILRVNNNGHWKSDKKITMRWNTYIESNASTVESIKPLIMSLICALRKYAAVE